MSQLKEEKRMAKKKWHNCLCVYNCIEKWNKRLEIWALSWALLWRRDTVKGVQIPSKVISAHLALMSSEKAWITQRVPWIWH